LNYINIKQIIRQWKRITKQPVGREKTHKAETTSVSVERAISPMPLRTLMSRININLIKNMLITSRNPKDSSSKGEDPKKRKKTDIIFRPYYSL
jgi:hypothetical protein